MKYNRLLKKKLNGGKYDLFSRTRLRLTLFYSFILTIFLIIFVTIVLFILFRVIISDEERRLNKLADYELSELQSSMMKPHAQKFRKENRTRFLSENQLFYYVTSADGTLLISNEAIGPLRPLFLQLLHDWDFKASDMKQVTVKVPTDLPAYRQFREFELRVLMLGRPIISHNEMIGTMYIGVDITYFNTIFKWVLIVVTSLAALFIGIAIWLSFLMSKRALIPIETAYNQQREFVANASHELRTPLSVILSSIEALEMEEKEHDAFTKKIMKGLKREVKRMSKLINDLLTLARLDSAQERMSLSREWFDFYPESKQVYESFRNLASEKQINLSFQANKPLQTYADNDKLTQLLYILLDNAIKYTNNGGDVNVLLDIKQHKQHRSLIISVKDTGMGMTEEERLRIFDRFYRINKARTRKEGGYGLGLSIAKWIVDAHHGEFSVSSEPGIGSEFIIRIPFK